MFEFALGSGAHTVRNVLFFGAHCDDIDIGCGGTAILLADRYPGAHFHWIIFSSDPRREAEARESAQRLLGGARRVNFVTKNFRNGFFPSDTTEIKEFFEALKRDISPDLIFTHYFRDRHQDHRVVGELTWNTFRDHAIFEYEIVKYEGDLGKPNVFVPIDKSVCDKKIDVLMTCFQSQLDKQWFDPETFRGLLRIRGVECNSPTRYAEAFHCRKVRLSIT